MFFHKKLDKLGKLDSVKTFYNVFALLIFLEQTLNGTPAWCRIGKSSIYIAVIWWPGFAAVLVGKLCMGMLAALLIRCQESLTCEHIIVEESPDLML